MITITYRQPSQEVDLIKDKLASMSLAYKDQVNDEHPIALRDNDDLYIGMESIQQYLQQLEGELNQWYYCDC